jgi:hypothetical protein
MFLILLQKMQNSQANFDKISDICNKFRKLFAEKIIFYQYIIFIVSEIAIFVNIFNVPTHI